VDRSDPEEDGLAARRLFCAALAESPSPADARGSSAAAASPGASGQGAQFSLGEAAAQHARVLRLAVGDPVELFDGQGHSLAARVDRLGKGDITCSALAPVLFTPRGPEVVLVQCLPKGKKLDDIVRMTTELGVSAIHLAVSERSVVQKSTRDDHKVERLVRIAREAARQSEQAYVPEIMEPSSLGEVLARAPEGVQRAALTERSQATLALATEPARLWLVVGPEGGLSSSDREILSHAKFVSQSLGRAILRTETAAVVGVGLGISALGRGR
jgi:16S rRNA (uracil1498-N3)-methyltransferase